MFKRSVILLVSFTAACGGSVPPPTMPVQLDDARVRRVVVKKHDFAPLVKELLIHAEPSAARLNLLAGAVRHQLLRGGRYFESSHEEAGLAATTGALLLIRAGELRLEMFDGTAHTLLAAASAVARMGDEGRTEAYYRLAHRMLEGQAQAEAETHLAALEAWRAATRPAGSMTAAAAVQQSAAERALVERTPQTVGAARRATLMWIERAFEEWQRDGAPRSQFEHEERVAAERAGKAASLTLAALYLRDGDAAAAASALRTEPVATIASPKLMNKLDQAAEGDHEAWAELFGWFEAAASVRSALLGKELAQAAAWGAAVALFREKPTSLQAVVPLSTLLVRHGMADVAPLVFRDALGDKPEPRQLNWALRLLFQALITAERNQDLELARQIYKNAAPVLGLAAARTGRVRPSAADFSYLMGAMESRAGELTRARGHLALSVKSEPTSEALRLLSAIDRQQGQPQAALASIRSIIALSSRAGDAASEAEAQLSAFQLFRERADQKAAGQALRTALSRALAAREKARTGSQLAVAERLLADTLALFGERAASERATTRAHDAARNDQRQLTATLLDAARRALMLNDLPSGRLALRRSLDANLDDNELIYAALWVKLLHERSGVPSDGGVEEALGRIERDGSWASTLRDWAKGTLNNTQLLARASTSVEKVEAEFYSGLGSYFQAPNSSARDVIDRVAKSVAIELIEVRIARGLLAPALSPPLTLPNGAKLP